MSLTVLVATADARDAAWLARCLGDAVAVVVAPTLMDVGARAGTASAIVVGDAVADGDAAAALAEIAASGARAPVVRIGDPRRIACDPRVAFVAPRSMPPQALTALIVSLAWGRPTAAATGAWELDAGEAQRRKRAFAATRRLATATDLAAAEAALVDALAILVDADRASCRFVDAAGAELWSPAAAGTDRPADRGLAGWAARTGGGMTLARASDDPRWDAAADDPVQGDQRALIQPVVGSGREIHAVLVAVRRAGRPPFTDDDLATAQALAAHAAPPLEQLARHVEASAYLAQAPDDDLFRREAVEAHQRPRWGGLVRVTPRWVAWTWLGLVVCLVGLTTFFVLGRTHRHAGGPAVVRMASRSEVASASAGNVGVVIAAPGGAVEAGDVLVRLDDAAQLADVQRVEQAFAARLRERLLAPSDPVIGEAVAGQRLDLERARAQLDERTVRAPHAGVIGDVRVRAGQRIEAGVVIASLVDPRAGAELLAVVPGGERPRLAPGQRLRLRLAGYPHAYQDLAVDTIASEAMGPDEARRYLGRIADDVQLRGPVVLVRARLPATFDADGVAYRYVDGMSGHVEIELGSERIIHALLPGLRAL